MLPDSSLGFSRQAFLGETLSGKEENKEERGFSGKDGGAVGTDYPTRVPPCHSLEVSGCALEVEGEGISNFGVFIFAKAPWHGHTPCIGVLEDGLSSNGVPRSTVPGGIPNPEKKTNCETQCPNPQSLSSGPLTQKQNGLQTTEAKRDAKRMSAKEVTINVTDSIQQMDRSRRITKNCVN
nr:brain and acute leukemia cytoplasmic protein [Macaca nemestrina]